METASPTITTTTYYTYLYFLSRSIGCNIFDYFLLKHIQQKQFHVIQMLQFLLQLLLQVHENMIIIFHVFFHYCFFTTKLQHIIVKGVNIIHIPYNNDMSKYNVPRLYQIPSVQYLIIEYNFCIVSILMEHGQAQRIKQQYGYCEYCHDPNKFKLNIINTICIVISYTLLFSFKLLCYLYSYNITLTIPLNIGTYIYQEVRHQTYILSIACRGIVFSIIYWKLHTIGII